MGSHHSLLHKDWPKNKTRTRQSLQSSQTQEDPKFVSQSGCQWQMLLMTCSVIAVVPNGTSYKARALLDSGSSTLFILEQVVQHLCLPHRHQDFQVRGIGGGTMLLSSQVFVNFNVKPVLSREKTHRSRLWCCKKYRRTYSTDQIQGISLTRLSPAMNAFIADNECVYRWRLTHLVIEKYTFSDVYAHV